MIFVKATHFHIYLLSLSACLAQCLSSVLNVKVVVGAFNQEKALVGAFSVIIYEPSDGPFSSTTVHHKL